MLDSVGDGAGIELPDGLQDGALEWFYSLRGGYRVMLRMRDSHSVGWMTQEYTFERRRYFLKSMVRGYLGEENTRYRVFCRKECRTHAKPSRFVFLGETDHRRDQPRASENSLGLLSVTNDT